MHLCIPVILEQNHIAVRQLLFSSKIRKTQAIFCGTDASVPYACILGMHCTCIIFIILLYLLW